MVDTDIDYSEEYYDYDYEYDEISNPSTPSH